MEEAISTGSNCPDCGRQLRPGEKSCPRCNPMRERQRARDDEDDDFDRPIRRRREETVEATDFLVPTNVSAWAVASCYLGLIGFCLPFIGLIFAIPAFICGIVALCKRSKAQNYGAVTSNIRAWIGLVLSSLSILGNLALVVAMLVSKK